MKRIMELLGRLILNEVQRKTCVSLSPDMREFLGWMLEVDREDELFEEVYSIIFKYVLQSYRVYVTLFLINKY